MRARICQVYRAWGLRMESEIELPFEPAASEPADEDSRPDVTTNVTIRRSEVPFELTGALQAGPTWQVADGRILVRVPGVARFLVTEGRDLAFEADPGSSDDNLRIFLLGCGLGALLHQRGSLALHASAIAVNGRAVLFCGPSGAGKSSLAAALGAAGYRMIADDVSLINVNASGPPTVAPDGRRLKLWADAIDALAMEATHDAVRPGIRKYWVEPPNRACSEAPPLAAIYFLRWEQPPFQPAIEPLRLVAGAELLRSCAYRPRLVQALRQEEVWFQKSLSLLSASRVFRLTRARDFGAMAECVARLEWHWQTALT